MGRTCFFPGCRSRDGNFISFHAFPVDEPTLGIWKAFCGRENATHRNLLCSVHFEPACFRDPSRSSKGLLKTAVPTLKVPELEAHGVEFLDGFETEVHRALQNHPAIETLENAIWMTRQSCKK
uniref:(northern house mosquito) hypothetical protein n=1 Tax=Culex pipiens TaxID=7175 RepID=A0A8D8J364_CULPI